MSSQGFLVVKLFFPEKMNMYPNAAQAKTILSPSQNTIWQQASWVLVRMLLPGTPAERLYDSPGSAPDPAACQKARNVGDNASGRPGSSFGSAAVGLCEPEAMSSHSCLHLSSQITKSIYTFLNVYLILRKLLHCFSGDITNIYNKSQNLVSFVTWLYL